MSPITTHVLDLTSGRPGSGIKVLLSVQDGLRWDDLAVGVTDLDGRVRDLLPEGTPIGIGTYRIRFDTYDYFLGQGVNAFHPLIVVHFAVDDPAAHYHVPLLLGPFGYTTYRGS